MTATGSTKRVFAALAVFAFSFAYFSLFRHYGFQVEDEGTLLFQLERAARGQYPYVDFGTGYTPGFFAVGAALLDALHFHLAPLRAAMALLHSLVAVGLYLLAAPLVGSVFALASPLAYVAYLPVWPGDFAAFNVPYPAWPATACWVTAALVMTAWMRRGGLLLPAAAGLVAGVAFGIKPNAGAFALAASAWILAFGSRGERGIDRAAGRAVPFAMLLGIWCAFALTVFSVDAAVHLPPCIALATLAATRGRALFATPRHPRCFDAMAAMGAGFALPTLAWAVPVLGRLGVDGFLRDVLLIGSNAADVYWLPHPRPELYALAVTGGVLGVAAAGWILRRGWLRPAPLFVLLACGSAAALVALRLLSLAPEGYAWSIVLQLENAGFWLVPLANYGAVALLARRISAANMGSDPMFADATRRFAALVPLAVAMYLQLYPRADFMHLVMGMPLVFVVGLYLLRRVAAWWSEGPWPAALPGDKLVPVYAAAMILFVLAARYSVNLSPMFAGDRRAAVSSPRASLWLEDSAADDLDAFGRTAAWLRQHATPGEPVLAFPALTGLLYLSGTSSPVFHDYWHFGRPDHDEEAAMLRKLDADPPRWAVTFNGLWYFFVESADYFVRMQRFACDRYRLVARFGRFDVLARRDVDTGSPGVEVWQPTGPVDEVADPALGARRQATRRWLAGLRPSDTRDAQLPATAVEQVLFLRGIRDAGDLRASAWLLRGYHSANARVRNEAIGAMDKVTEARVAALHRWSCEKDPDDTRPYVENFVDEAEALRESQDPRARRFAEALLAAARS